MNDVARLRAARAIARGETKAAAAREAGVDRATIGRWSKTPEFQDLVLKATEPPSEEAAVAEEAELGLRARVPKALRVLDDALEGKDVSPQMATVALNIIKAARQFEPPSEEETGPSTLTSLIARLDAEATGS